MMPMKEITDRINLIERSGKSCRNQPKRKKNKTSYVGIFIVFGLPIGFTVALILGWNIALGMSLGVSIGIIIGAIKDAHLKHSNEQESVE